MEKEFIGGGQSKQLKELGFDEKCFGFYNQNGTFISNYNSSIQELKGCDGFCLAITYQQSLRFFREKYNIDSVVIKDDIGQYFGEIRKNTYPVNYNLYTTITEAFESYEETEKELLNKLIELCKKI